MTAEGDFPKVDGDVLYASEASRFARAGGVFGTGSTTLVGSGATTQDIGSVVIGAGSLSDPTAYLDIVYKTTGGGTNFKGLYLIEISGVDANTSIKAGSHANTANNVEYGRIMACMNVDDGFNYGTTEGVATRVIIGEGPDLFPGSEVVVKFQVKHDSAASHGFAFYGIQSFRGSV